MKARISTNRLAIFAYGSLLSRPGFAYVERQRAVALGYARQFSQAVATDSERQAAVTWIAPPGNPYDAGQLALDELATHMRSSEGPSGRNADYVFQLEQALEQLGAADPRVSELAARLRR